MKYYPKLGYAPTVKEGDSAFDKVRADIIKQHGAAALVGTPENRAASEKRKKEAEPMKLVRMWSIRIVMNSQQALFTKLPANRHI